MSKRVHKAAQQAGLQSEEATVKIERVPRAVLATLLQRAPRSLRPGPALMEAFAEGDEEARLILESWRPRLPIRLVTPERYEEMLEGGRVQFGG